MAYIVLAFIVMANLAKSGLTPSSLRFTIAEAGADMFCLVNTAVSSLLPSMPGNPPCGSYFVVSLLCEAKHVSACVWTCVSIGAWTIL